jgi:hypothetical protein
MDHIIHITVTGTGTYNAKLFMETETYKGSEMTAGDWTLIHTEQVQGQGPNDITPLGPMNNLSEISRLQIRLW